MTEINCRTCLREGKLRNIFEVGEDFITISTKLISILKIKIEPNDGLPQKICSKCVKALGKCIDFINMCVSTDLKLKALMLKKSSSDEDSNTTSINCENNLSLFEQDHVKSIVTFKDNNNEDPDISLQDTINNKLNDKKTEKQQCFTCGRVMSSKYRLKTHLRIHTGERPFTCTHCNKTFSQAQNLKVHLRRHTGEKPLKCSICGARFAQSSGLVVHYRKHTGRTPYQCSVCPRSFRTIAHLQYHSRGHTGEKNYECDICSKSFITRSDLKQHIRTHTKEKPYVCNICGVHVSRMTHLKRHIKNVHNSIKEFMCMKCNKKFTKKKEFYEHNKKDHHMGVNDDYTENLS